MIWVYNDGGRAEAGYRGSARDCVVRAIAIATEQPYAAVYKAVNAAGSGERVILHDRRQRGRSSARNGVYKPLIRRYLSALGWTWTPTMQIGSGCKVHLTDGELPMGRLIVSVSRHLVAVIDGVIHDTHDPQRGGAMRFGPDGRLVSIGGGRCVYGYWRTT